MNTRALAHSIGSRRGTASSVARIMPVEYSAEITRTPRTQTTSWPKNPLPRMKLTGSPVIAARSPSAASSHDAEMRLTSRVVKPRLSRT
ncbi:hypothetical protein GCM10010208_11520 [Actinomadura livida]|nr:hypothetical protein GCM10010208_11520 [Actinomadura livida]